MPSRSATADPNHSRVTAFRVHSCDVQDVTERPEVAAPDCATTTDLARPTRPGSVDAPEPSPSDVRPRQSPSIRRLWAGIASASALLTVWSLAASLELPIADEKGPQDWARSLAVSIRHGLTLPSSGWVWFGLTVLVLLATVHFMLAALVLQAAAGHRPAGVALWRRPGRRVPRPERAPRTPLRHACDLRRRPYRPRRTAASLGRHHGGAGRGRGGERPDGGCRRSRRDGRGAHGIHLGAAGGNVVPVPAGIASTEAALATGLIAAGVSTAQAISAVILYCTVTFWAPVPAWLLAARSLRRRRLL